MAKKRADEGNRVQVSPEDFVKAWAKGGTVADVASRLGLSIAGVRARGVHYRKRGIRLPMLQRMGRPGLDIVKLNSLL